MEIEVGQRETAQVVRAAPAIAHPIGELHHHFAGLRALECGAIDAFDEGNGLVAALAQFRDLLEPGTSVVVTVSAEDRPEGINLRIQTVQSLEEQANRAQKAMRVYLRDAAPVQSLASRLSERGDGQVSLVVLRGEAEGEIEIDYTGKAQSNYFKATATCNFFLGVIGTF